MRTKFLLLPATAVTALMVGAGPAMAHPVGEHGTPNCFGQRISHGSSDHKLTPKDRVARLQELVDSGEVPEANAYFGETVTVREFIAFVKVNCSDNPLVLPFL